MPSTPAALTRAHSMPFGAAVTGEGVGFRLWAPSARTVEIDR